MNLDLYKSIFERVFHGESTIFERVFHGEAVEIFLLADILHDLYYLKFYPNLLSFVPPFSFNIFLFSEIVRQRKSFPLKIDL